MSEVESTHTPPNQSAGHDSTSQKFRQPLHLIPYHQDPLQYLADLIIQRHVNALPNLTEVVVLLSQSNVAPWLRRKLTKAAKKQGHQALLGPHISSFPEWIKDNHLIEAEVYSDATRELLLVEALLDHPHLYGQGSPWALAGSLMQLFDELTRNHVSLPDNLEDFEQLLQQAYGLSQPHLSALGKEAALVHTLWKAMQQQLQNLGVVDSETAYILQLQKSSETLSPNTQFYIAGFHQFTLAQQQWIKNLSDKNQLTVVFQGEPSNSNAEERNPNYREEPESHYSPNDIITNHIQHLEQLFAPSNINAKETPLSQCLAQVYSPQQGPLKQRAKQCAAELPDNPIASHLALFEANHAEAEARAVDLQVRRWLLNGHSRIGIITENRRLARRVRALLERSGIALVDAAGWALSTTSAATVIERWLQCIEEDFHYLPFLDFLKSPFVFPDMERDTLLQIVYRLEQSIIQKENIASGLERYLLNTKMRSARLAPEMVEYYDAIEPLLVRVKQAATPLEALFGEDNHPPVTFLQALTQSLNLIGVVTALEGDSAGQQLLRVVEQLKTAVLPVDFNMSWNDFRAWLGRAFEHAFFQPPQSSGPVHLMSLQQSDLQMFDAIIIAAAEQEYLPGAPQHSPFFNDAVRAALGLITAQQSLQNKFYFFRRLLQSITTETQQNQQPRLLLTRRISDNNEDIIASPWLEAIQTFHTLAYETTLIDTYLAELVDHPQAQVSNTHAPLPKPLAQAPRTNVNLDLIPSTITASSYQQLMNCPYQFFASRCLKLSPPESVREMLEKSDYGERVHLCLQAFHSNVRDLPGPFTQKLNETNKTAATALLNRIAEAVFSQDIEDNFIHRGWLKRWQELIPVYIDWQIKQAENWQVWRVEQEVKDLPLTANYKLSGRLDRIDVQENHSCIIDYKTGLIPHGDDVNAGEAVQLPFYALLAESLMAKSATASVQRVDYLSLSEHTFGNKIFIESERLDELKQGVANRLIDMLEAINAGSELTAWGDSKTCDICTMQGLCRKGTWENDVEA
ncbi:PD-(D/E)XK nuclease family protein [Kaarinaea lacus]